MIKTDNFPSFNKYIENLKSKKVAVVGLGIGNIDLFKF